MNSSFEKFRDDSTRAHIQKYGRLFSLIGIPSILFFFAADQSIVGIEGSLGWRVFGIAPLVLFVATYIASKLRREQVPGMVAQCLGTSMILGVTGMTAALLFKVMMDWSSINAVSLAGTIAGNLLAIFVAGLLRGVRPGYSTAAIVLPYAILVMALLLQGVTQPILWVFVGNVLVAIPLVLIVVWQRERGDEVRLHALYELQEERRHLEEAVAERTKALEAALKELDHLVRNNMQTILCVINLYEQDPSVNLTGKKLQMIQRSVEIIAHAYDMTHDGQILETVSMRSFLNEICSDKNWSEEEFTIECDIEDAFFDVQTTIVVGLIFVHFASLAHKRCLVAFRSDRGVPILSITIDGDTHDDPEDIGVAGQLADLIKSKIRTERQGAMVVTRITMPRPK